MDDVRRLAVWSTVTCMDMRGWDAGVQYSVMADRTVRTAGTV